MFATAFHDRVSLAILGGVTFALALVASISQHEPSGFAAPDEVVAHVPRVTQMLDCTASTSNARRCAHALHMSRQTRAAADLLWSVIHPCCHSGPDWRVNNGVQSNGTWNDAFEVRDLAAAYESFLRELDALERTDPTRAYWPLPGLRRSDLALGAVYAIEIDAKLREMAPRAANLYAKGTTREDCINYMEPADMARSLGIAVDPLPKRCRGVRL